MNKSLALAITALLTATTALAVELENLKGDNTYFGIKTSFRRISTKTDCEYVSGEITKTSQTGVFEFVFGKCTNLGTKHRATVDFKINREAIARQQGVLSMTAQSYPITETEFSSDVADVKKDCDKVAEKLNSLTVDKNFRARNTITFNAACLREGKNVVLDVKATTILR